MAGSVATSRIFKTSWFTRANIGRDELEDFRSLAGGYARLTDAQLVRLLNDADLMEICHGQATA